MDEAVSPVEVFKFIHKRVPKSWKAQDVEDMEMLVQSLKNVPHCYRSKVETCIGWLHHLEHERTPWEDDFRLWYADGTYIDKRYLFWSEGKKCWLLNDRESARLFRSWNEELNEKNGFNEVALREAVFGDYL